MLNPQRSVNRVSRSRLWSRALSHLVVIGVVSMACAWGIVAARVPIAPGAIAAVPPAAADPLQFDLVSLARGAEVTQTPTGGLRFELDPEAWEPPVSRESDPQERLGGGDEGGAFNTASPPSAPSAVTPIADVVKPDPTPAPVTLGAPFAAEDARAAAPVPVAEVVTSLAWPVAGGTVSQYFHGGHPAIDIAAPWGSAVVAAAPGVVTFAGWRNNGGGFVVEIDHGNGLVTAYNHLAGVSVGYGQAVAQGEGIGAVGCTGLCTGSHLHFVVLVAGYAQNPMRFL